MPPTLRVDWFRVIVELQAQGFTTEDIGNQTGVVRTTVIAWKNDGTEPRHRDGERLIAFWAAATGKCRDDLPLAEVELSAAGCRK